ncbi:MAG: cation:proton antiporter [Candidatus Limnocylindrales bacterium]|nr:cation:proton antiporter [Candidatus Limnocylindrales bacterium]
MTEISFSNLVIVAAVAFAAPLALGLFPKLRLPAVVLEIVLGIAVGPSGLGWVKSDLPVQVLALVGLAFLLFLAGLDVELGRLRGRLLRLAGLGFVLSLGLALAAGYALSAAGQVRSPLFVGIVLSATALGLVAPILKDAGEIEGEFGQLVLAGATIADFGAVILLSLLFSNNAGDVGSRLTLLGSFVALVAAAGFGLARTGRSKMLSGTLGRLGDTTAQIRVRGAVLLLIGFVGLAERFGLQTILGAFMAGVILRIVDADATATHPHFRLKLDGIGYGFLIPVFFVSSGVEFNLSALLSSASTMVRVPIFLLALLIVRAIPALLYRRVLGNRRTVAAGLLQATSLSFVVAAVQIGTALGQISAATGAALIGAGLLSVMLFPLLALMLLGGSRAKRNGQER